MPTQKSDPMKTPQNSWYSIQAKAAGAAEVLLYDDIGLYGVTAQQFAQEIRALGSIKHIDLRIHSRGGDVFEGIAIYNMLKAHPAKITVHIDGLAASMASVIAMVGDTIIMAENSMMMIHKPFMPSVGGNADDLRELADRLDKAEAAISTAYARTGQSVNEVKALLKAVTWYTAQEAVTAGFADKVTEPLQAVAKLQAHTGYENMPKQAQAFFEPQNTTGEAPQAAAPVAQPAPQAALAVADEAAIVARLQAAETQRREDIKAVFTGFDQHSGLMSECMLDASCSADQAKDKLLAKLSAGITPTASIHVGNGNVVGDSIKNSIMARLGMAAPEAGNGFAGCTLAELARASLTERGVSVAGLDRLAMVNQAFTHTSSDFSHILQDVAHKSVLKGYEESEESFEQFTSKGVLTDFRPSRRVSLGTFPSLKEVGEGAEYTHGTIGDRGEQIALATYGRMFTISRKAIINDDLSVLTKLPTEMGRAAKRTIADLVFAVLSGNPKMADGKALFHADHGNIATGADLSIDAIGAAMTKMRMQKDGAATLNITPRHLLVSPLNEMLAHSLLNAEYNPALIDARAPNPIRNRFNLVVDPRLAESAFAGACFLLADGNVTDTIEVAYLDGNDKPYIEQQEGFNVDGIAYKVRIDAGVAPLDWRTMVKMPPKS